MKPIITGFALAIVFIAVMFVVPTFMPRATKTETLKALREAELARRQLTAFDPTMPLAAQQSDLEQLKQADLGQLTERSPEAFAALQSDFNRVVQNAKSLDRRSGLGDTALRPVSPGTAAVNGFQQAVQANDKLLTEAVRNAKSASQADQNALGVGQIVGFAKLTEADNTLAAARPLRTDLAAALDRMLLLAVRCSELQALNEHYAGLDLTDVAKTLTEDLAEVGTRIDATNAELNAVDEMISKSRQAVEEIRTQLREKQDARLLLEQAGFDVADTAAFEKFRDEYERLSRELDALQTREQLLTQGGILGGVFTGDDLVSGEIQDGESVVGLSELEGKATLLRTTLERLEKARASLDAQRALVTGLTDDSKSLRAACDEKMSAAKAEFDAVRARAAELAQQGFEREDVALRAAREAASGFKTAKNASNQWKNGASTLQREHDPQKLNERLKLIISDEAGGLAAESGEAQATALAGRILTERALALQGYLNLATRTLELLPDAELDVTALRENYTQAHDDAIQTLNAAREMYTQLAQKQASAAWIHKSSLATIHALLAQVDETNAARHRGDLLALLGEILNGRQQYPYLQQQVMLFSALGGSAAPAPQPLTPTPEPAPAETPGSEG